MKKVVIALRGKSNVGKSNTIKEVYEQLKKRPTAQIESEKIGIDVRAVIIMNGIKIGLESMGDPNSRLSKSLKLFIDIGCQIIVCATRTKGKTVEIVTSMQNSYKIYWIDKDNLPGDLHKKDNREKTKKIIQQIDEVLVSGKPVKQTLPVK